MVDEKTDVVSTLADIARSLPAPVETSLLKTLGTLLGGVTAIPAAWLKRPAQAIDDVTASRSAVSAIVAKAVAEDALKDPVLMQAATEIYLPTTLRKARNRIQIAQRAAEHAAEKALESENSAPPNDDWMNSFMRFAEDASSEELQDLFARVLAGEVVRPGSFTLPTLRAVSELDQSIAKDFTEVWSKSVGEAVDYSVDFQRGEWFVRWKRLAEAGLMAPSMTVQYLPEYQPRFDGNAVWLPMSADDTHLTVYFPEGCRAQWQHVDFTRVGRQIGSLLPRPDYVSNMRSAGLSIARQGVRRVELYSVDRPVETVFLGE